MRLNWAGYQYRFADGYGRYGRYMVRALLRAGVEVTPVLMGEIDMPKWMQEMRGTRFDDRLTISCLPPYYLRRSPGPHWLLTMTEGSECPDGWADIINESGVERVIVPCQHNADAFVNGGVKAPISVIPGGTDPDEFPLLAAKRPERPYTFLALADRGKRKGWCEAYAAFFKAFDATVDNVRLVIKCRPGGNDLIDLILDKCAAIDPRITFLREDLPDIADFYRMGDCLVIPSRSEGWGMPHREAAMMGLPVITQAYSGMDDGHTREWAIVVEKGHMEPLDATEDKHIEGQWRRCDWDELASKMRQCYGAPAYAAQQGLEAAAWLRANQTWQHSANALLQLLQREGVFAAVPAREREYA